MRNLRNIHRSLLQRSTNSPLTATTWDVSHDGSIIAAFGPTKDGPLIELKRWLKWEKSWTHIASWDAAEPLPDHDCDEVVDLHHFSDTASTVIVLAAGDLVVIREDPQPGEEKIEIVGTVDAGISAVAWSPDEELLVITTLASTLLYMTKDFDNLVNTEFSADDFKVSNHVSVGWGKKETQFKGKKARALRDPTMPETIDEGMLHANDTKRTTISWRGDGAYCAINSIQDSRRVVRIYSREGVPESVSEPVDFLTNALSWRPAGNLIASIQRLEDKVLIVFFEKNGLRHGQFDLRLSKEEMEMWWAKDISIRWNIDSSVLAVCFLDRVQLWTMGNYHYYLKQEIFCGSQPSTSTIGFCWHPEKPLHFALQNDYHVQRLAYASIISSPPTSQPPDYGLTPVVDGRILKLTPLRLANVPPPMALHELEVANNITDVAILSIGVGKAEDQTHIAVLHQGVCSIFQYGTSDIQAGPIHVWEERTMGMNSSLYPMSLQIRSRARKYLDILHNSTDGFSLSRMIYDQENTKYSVERATNIPERTEILLPQKVPNNNSSYIIVDGRILPTDFQSLESPRLSLPASSSKFQGTVDATLINLSRVDDNLPLTNGNGVHSEVGSLALVRLEDNGSLYVGDRCLAKGCTSFLTTSSHLIYTTKNLLKFVHLTPHVDDLEVPPDTPESDERCRSIERGARIVTVMPSIFAVVLQMPRGNLETIYPRALVVAGVRDSINQKKYKKAFLACRNRRVDMNILHDHAPEQFLSNVGLFIDQVRKVEHIDLFLSQLKEEDVTMTMYKETLRPSDNDKQSKNSAEIRVGEALPTEGSKINRTCKAFLQSLEDQPSQYLQNTISAYVCMTPPNLDAALLHIAKLRKSNSDRTDAMIEHICFLADVNKLYDNALGLYDLEMTLLIAQQSQKDPREYLPFLQNIQKMSDIRRKYAIDDHLGRQKKALRHLCDLDAFEEVKVYVVKHSLCDQAISYYHYQQDKLSELTRLYASFLQTNGNFKDAGIGYESLQDYDSASDSFRQAHLWRESLSCAMLASFETERLQPLAISLSDTLVETKDFHSAAIIKLDHLDDIPAAARLFCKGYYFADAIRIAALHRRLDLLESVIDTGLNEGMATMTELLADCKSQLNAQIPRIRELRIKKAEDPLAFWDGDIPGGGDVPDDVSIAPTDASTTGGSLFTRYTNRTGTVGTNATRRTSKNRRREERKRARGKKGSVYEEEYLVNSVGRLVERVNSVNEEISRLVVGLMRRGMREQARSVEAAMLDITEMCKGCIEEVFQSERLAEKSEAKPGDAHVNGYEPPIEGSNLLDEVQNQNIKPEPPIVRAFEKLTLLGR